MAIQGSANAHRKPRIGGWLLVATIWLINIASAIAVVGVTQTVRNDIGTLEKLRRQSAELDVQWGQYLLEKSTWASYARVEKIARKSLGMQVPDPSQVILVKQEP